MKRNLPPAEDFLGYRIPGTGYELKELKGSGCNAHVFVARDDALKRDVACKVVPVANLIGADLSPPLWETEVTKANSLGSDKVVQFFRSGRIKVDGHDCIYLLSDLVRGVSLKEYVKQNGATVEFVVDFLGVMFDFLRELQLAEMTHGDFHSGNILVEDRTSALVGPRRSFRVTDFGVAPITSGPADLIDDFEQLAKTLLELLSVIDVQAASSEDRFVFARLHDEMPKLLIESDSAHDPRARSPSLLFRTLEEYRHEFANLRAGSAKRTLSSPFEYLSCEQIGESHSLLKELYSNKLLGLAAIQAASNLVLTGPRGCGKTTVYRSRSLKHRYYTSDDSPAQLDHIGIYYRCDDLYFNFPRYRLPTQELAWDVPCHFVTATLIRELLETLRIWSSRHDSQGFGRQEEPLCREIGTILGLALQKLSLKALEDRCDKERDRAAKKHRMLRGNPDLPCEGLWGPDLLPKVCAVVKKHVPLVERKDIFFYIDDYSKPKISADLQRNLNRMIMQRTPECFFKVATESPASFESSDVDGKAYVEGREFQLVNLGMDFISAAPEEKLMFVEDVFNKRFAYVEGGYPVSSLEDLLGLGDIELSHNEIARRIRNRQYPILWGTHSLADICSGDLHFLIDLVGKMVSASGGAQGISLSTSPRIDRSIQNKTIRTEAGNFLKHVRSLPNGKALVEVVQAFGAVAASYLRHKDSKNEENSPPHQASRIEPFEEPHLEGAARSVYDDLLRYAIFIEDVRGKSRRGSVVPRLYLRRFLIPFFNLTFSRRDSIELDVPQLRMLLLDPKRFETARLRSEQDTENEGQLSLLK